MKKKLSEEVKTKLIYSGELILIAIIFLTIGILEIVGVMRFKDVHIKIFNWVTIFGGTWLIIDFLWGLFSKTRRKRICLLDKIIMLPLGIYLISLDIFCFSQSELPSYFYQFHISGAFLYIAVSYTFQGIYHWKKPLPMLMEEAKMAEQEKEIEEAVKELNEHHVIAFPTETVFGLGVLYNDYEAYTLLNQIKQRPEDKPYTMMLSDVSQIREYAYVDEKQERVIKMFMPGSLTILVKGKENLPEWVSHGTNIIGIRIPDHQKALSLLRKVNLPLLVPSANKSGQKPCLNAQEVRTVFQDEIKVVVSGDVFTDQPSTIVDLTKETPVIIREGPIKEQDIMDVWNEASNN